MAAVLEKQAKRWTYEEYYRLDDGQRYDKKELYARFGVKEYWIGDPANKALEVLTLKEGRYELHGCAEEKGKLASPVLAGLEFDLSAIL